MFIQIVICEFDALIISLKIYDEYNPKKQNIISSLDIEVFIFYIRLRINLCVCDKYDKKNTV